MLLLGWCGRRGAALGLLLIMVGVHGLTVKKCDPAMQTRLRMTKDWDANKTDLLFVFKAAQVAYIVVQENFSLTFLATRTQSTWCRPTLKLSVTTTQLPIHHR